MEFRPCIDIHNGKVKQIVGSSLADEETGQWRILSPERMLRIMHIYIRKRDFAADISFC